MYIVTTMFSIITDNFKKNVSNARTASMSVQGIWSSLLKTHPDIKVDEVAVFCEKLTAYGHLSKINSLDGLYTDRYLPMRHNTRTIENVIYGILDFIVLGFPFIRNCFVDSVFPILVEIKDEITKESRFDIGSCFLIDKKFIVTAKHCVENAISIQILSNRKLKSNLKFVYLPPANRGEPDLAILEFSDEIFENQKSFRLASAQILDSVLTMGYPPIPGFSDPPVQVAEIAQIAGQLKSTTGLVVGEGHSYLDGTTPMLISARVKGGNSGGPVINQMGLVIGVVSATPSGAEGIFDSLGYGVVTPAGEIEKLINRIGSEDDELLKISSEPFEDIFRLIRK